MTQCNTKTRVDFHPDKPVDLEFDADDISSDGGAVLLAQADERLGLCEAVAGLMDDERDSSKVEHSRLEQLKQRVFQIAMGWADQNDADRLREDAVFKTVAGRQPEDDPLSSQPTLSVFENSVDMATNKSIMETLEFDWMRRLDEDREVVVLDVDASGFEGHGQQELLHYCGFHQAHIHHPLFVMDGQTGEVVTALLRPGKVGDSRGVVGLLRRIVGRLKCLRPDIKVVVRGDAGFGRPQIYRELERLDAFWGSVSYVFGISKNSAFERKLEDALKISRQKCEETGQKAQTFQWFEHQAQSWAKSRSIVGKAEVSPQGDNPRFVVTDIDQFPARQIYRRGYCPRGDAENIVKSFKSHVQGDRLSCPSFSTNFFRMLQALIAHRLLMVIKRTCQKEAKRRRTIRRKTDKGDDKEDNQEDVVEQLAWLGRAQLDTLRLMALKVAALVDQSVRRIHVRMPETHPTAPAFQAVAGRLATY